MFERLLSPTLFAPGSLGAQGWAWLFGLALGVAAVAWVSLAYKKRLHRNAAVLEAVLDISPEPVLTLDAQGRILQANGSTQRLFGYAMDELAGKPLRQLTPALQHLDLEDVLLYQGGPGHGDENGAWGDPKAGPGLEVLGHHSSGRPLNLFLTARRLETAADAVYVVTLRDHSALKEQRRRERLAHEDTQALLNALTDFTIVTEADPAGTILKVNAAFVAISGYRPSELLGHDHRTVSSGKHSRVFWEGMWMQLRQGKPWRGEICNRRKNGELYWLDTLVVPQMDASGNIERIISVRQDITARVNHEWLLQKTHDLLALEQHIERTGGWEHDTQRQRTLWSDEALAVFGATSDNMPDLPGCVMLAVEKEAYINALRQSMEHGIGWRLDLQMQTHNQGKRWVRMICKVAHNAQQHLRLFGTVQDITHLKTKPHNLLPERAKAYDTLARHGQFLEIMSHELRTPLNAILGFGHMMETDGQLRPEQAEHLREIMAAGRQLTAVVNEVIELSTQGTAKLSPRASAQAEQPLPVVGPDPGATLGPTPHAARLNALLEPSIVYIDDNEVNLKLLAKVIGRARHYRIHCFANPVAGLAYILEKPPELVLLDIHMPQMDGYEVLHQLRKAPQLSGLKVVALTANDSPQDRERGTQAGFDGFLGKPIVDFAAFLQQIDHHLERPAWGAAEALRQTG